MTDTLGPRITRRALLAAAPTVLTGRLTSASVAAPAEAGFRVEPLIEPRHSTYFHFVMAGEGFRADERHLFLKQADRYAEAVRRQEPFSAFADRLKISLAWAPSQDSGVQRVMEIDRESAQWALRPTDKRTAFRSVLYAGRYVIEVGDFHAIRAVRVAVAEPIDNLIVVVNEASYGGGARAALDMPAAAYHAHRVERPISFADARKEFTFGLTVVSSEPKVGGRVLIHELGHSVANLGEEYFEPTSAYQPVADHPVAKKPNVSVWSDPDRVKWKDLLGKDRVGVFEGAEGFGRGLYRPWDDGCVMRIAERPHFCPVCSRAIKQELVARTEQKAR
jgi:hypothetical protein